MNRRWKPVPLGILVALTTLTVALADSLDLSWYTIDGGGDMWIGGDDLELSGTIGQHDASVFTMSGGGFELVGGFWNRAERVPNWRLVTPEAPEPLDEEYEEAVAEPLPPP
jgi:hypothetical protein